MPGREKTTVGATIAPALRCGRIAALLVAAVGLAAAASAAGAQQDKAPKRHAPGPATANAAQAGREVTAGELLHVPVVNLQIAGVVEEPQIVNPVANDPQAPARGMEYFNQFNCVGCHAPNGAGGMGPSLSNAKFKYGRSPAQIYLTILQGRPKGMPAWGGRLPDHVIWDIVAYIRSISKKSTGEWGQTVSLSTLKRQQTPAEFLKTTDPWKYTIPFTYGQKPLTKPGGNPKPGEQK